MIYFIIGGRKGAGEYRSAQKGNGMIAFFRPTPSKDDILETLKVDTLEHSRFISLDTGKVSDV